MRKLRIRRVNLNPRFSKSFPLLIDIKKVSVNQTEKYYRNKDKINKVILSKTDPHEVIHGEYAVQRQIPSYLHRHTNDIDIFSQTPLKDAIEVEKALDKKFKGDCFSVNPGMHPGTWKVVAHANKQSVADYTRPDKDIPHVTINGLNYATLRYMKDKAKKTLQNPLADFRQAKDQDTINRITLAKKKEKK